MFTRGTSKARCNRRYGSRSTGKAMAPLRGAFFMCGVVCPARLINMRAAGVLSRLSTSVACALVVAVGGDSRYLHAPARAGGGGAA